MLHQHEFQPRFASWQGAPQQSTRLTDKTDNKHPSGENTILIIPTVSSDEKYPVRRVYCLGRNDAAGCVAICSAPWTTEEALAVVYLG